MENFVKVFILLVEVAQEVVRSFLQYKSQQHDFKDFLRLHQHEIYHLCFNTPCCQCDSSSHLQRQQIIKKTQFDKLFVKPRPDCGLICSCSYDVLPNVKLTDIDITLCAAFINNCCSTLTPQEIDSMRDIRQVRNEIAHHPHDADFDPNEFYTTVGKLKNSVIYLSNCVGPDYSEDIQNRIRHIEKRPYLAVEYTDVLRQIVQWKLDRKEDTTKEIARLDERLSRIENKLDDLRLSQQETNVKELTFDEQTPENCSNIEESLTIVNLPDDQPNSSPESDRNSSEYFAHYAKIEALRKSGTLNSKDAIVFSVLVHNILHGPEIEMSILAEIYECLYNTPSQIQLQTYLEEQLESCSDEIEDCIVRIFDNDTIQAVTVSFRNECPECFLKICKPETLLKELKMKQKDDLHLGFSACEILVALSSRIPNNTGEFISTLNDLDIVAILNANGEIISFERIFYMLDGITRNGTDFSLFEQFEKLSNCLCGFVDKAENTIFHLIVIRFPKCDKFILYMDYFCEKKIQVMYLENCNNVTPIDLASYLGRHEIIARVICNEETNSEIISRVSNQVKKMLCILKSDAKEFKEIKTELEKLKWGETKDYYNILELIGEEPSIEDKESDTEAAVGKFFLGKITDIKKGLNAITKIPSLIKTIHQATNLDDAKRSEAKK